MTKRNQVFVEVTEEEKELVRTLAFKLRLTQSNIVKAVAFPTLRKLEDAVDDPEKARKIRAELLKRVSGEE